MKTTRSILFTLLIICISVSFLIIMLITWFYNANIGNKDPDEYILLIVGMICIEVVLIVITTIYAYKYKKNKKL